ncbi:MAG: hypothetical protein FDZ70_09735 [Actinobacteria bacterium]|nr:MAG: hypothetical protein FDZ70_09735 [Actinomycetota bacterium]
MGGDAAWRRRAGLSRDGRAPAGVHSGRVDAVVTFEPVRSKLVSEGAGVLFDSSRIPGEIVDILVVRDSVLRDRPGDVRALISGWEQAVQHLRRDPTDAARRMATREQMTPEEFAAAQELLEIPDAEGEDAFFDGEHPALLTTAESLQQVMLRQRLLDKHVDATLLLEGVAEVRSK